jgi:hypothetical protein
MHADATHVRDRLESFEKAGKPAVAQREGVAATRQDFSDARVGADEFEFAAEDIPPRALRAVRKLAPEAATTMDGAGGRGCQQFAAVVFVQQPGSGACHVTAGYSQWEANCRATGWLDPHLAQAKACSQFLRVADSVPQGLLPGGWG